MAVWVYKCSESELIDALTLPAAQAAGWSITKGDNAHEMPNKEEETVTEKSEQEEIEILKAKAKVLGMKGYGRMSLETLREKLND